MKTTTLILQLLVNRLTFSGKSWYFSQALDYFLWFNITVNYFDEYLTLKIENLELHMCNQVLTTKIIFIEKSRNIIQVFLPQVQHIVLFGLDICLLYAKHNSWGLHDGSLLPSSRESITYTGGTQHGDDTYYSHHHWVVPGSHSCI